MEDLLKLIDKNFSKNVLLATKEPAGMQMVKTEIGVESENVALNKHLLEILKEIVYSKEYWVKGSDHGLYCMQGFLERTGRMPTKDDEIHIIKGRYFLTLIGGADSSGQRYYISELNFYITSK